MPSDRAEIKSEADERLDFIEFDCDATGDALPAERKADLLAQKATTAASTIRALSEGRLRPEEWTLHGMLPRRGVAVLYAPSGEGKSFVALALALRAAIGGDFLGKKIASGPVVYASPEDFDGVRCRLAASVIAMKLGSNPPPIAVVPGPLDLRQCDDVEALADVAWRFGSERWPDCSLIVVDTLTAAIGDGDQDDGATVSALMSGAHALSDAVGAPILIIHHTGHSETRPRGSSILRDRADVLLRVRRRGRIEDGELLLTVEKLRNGPEGARIAFRSRGHPVTIGSCTMTGIVLDDERLLADVADAAEDDHAARPATRQDQVLGIIRDLCAGNGETTVDAMREAVQAAGLFDGLKADSIRKTLGRYLETFSKTGVIRHNGTTIVLGHGVGTDTRTSDTPL